jgi:peptidoglycan/xylan/chitin deacetylase (PgdA/CDA1 family)
MRALLKTVLPAIFPVEYNRDRGERRLYLSFDDGPTPGTLALLDTLARHDVKATFFILGKRIAGREDILAAVASAGHCIGNHSFSHHSARQISHEEIRNDMAACDEAIRRVVPGWSGGLCRPPYGDLSMGFLRYASAQGQRIVQWSRDSVDYRAAEVANVEANLGQLTGGDILLFHDEFAVTNRAMDELIPKWKQQGFTFATL